MRPMPRAIACGAIAWILTLHPQGVLALEAAPDGAIYFSDAAGIYKLVSVV